MSVWTPLLPAAMVGTERAPAWSAALPGPIGAVLRELEAAAPDAATRLLQSAAVLATCSRAGAQGVLRTSPKPAAAASDRWPPLPAGALQLHLAWALREGPARLQHEALCHLAEAGWRLPTTLLPLALDLGRRATPLRSSVIAALGERGLWLARQNPEWRYAAGASAAADDEDRWAHGSIEQRRELLAQERGRDPQAARERLAAELPGLAARERADLIGTLAHRLGPDDEPLLTGLLGDRSREVRQLAVGLLVRLPDSAFVRRAGERLAALLRQEQSPLRRRWQIEAPAAASPDWDQDAIDATRPKQESLGERGWWLYQLASRVPLAWWSGHTGLSPAELVAWGLKSDWSEALLRAWRDVLLQTAELEAIEALLAGWPRKGPSLDAAALLALLPLERRERHWQQQLSQGANAWRTLLPQLLDACPSGVHLSPAFSEALAGVIRSVLADPSIVYDYTLRPVLPELCCLLHPSTLSLLAALPQSGNETPAHAEALHTASRIVEARRVFHSPTSAPTAP
ncbi:DUF5691 domain-containing protein [Aquabacterium sp. A7-Y]|uniref:DUF5691 domain-containing protein n=1 Tax=Aquabacterium sp. A7-Y TaxID=1349605 RepID=UPI00223CC0AC|nr:DUF5691 domain-containing protein [Aquabacterium sp. A7-Y]MCW7539002.1 DUF5691 domain-containing protein [Aquabacterium sp. A7-Y]